MDQIQQPDWDILVRLLQRQPSDYKVEECLKILGQEYPARLPKPVRTNEILTIYTDREEFNREQEDPIYGYESLLPSLRQETDEWVYMYSVRTESNWYIIFTNSYTDKLLGILNGPTIHNAYYMKK